MPKPAHASAKMATPVGEAAAWRAVGAGWRQLSGSFHRLGFSFEWHDFETPEDVDWAQSFHPESVELCLNLSGTGEVRLGEVAARYGDLSAGFYRQGGTPLAATRRAGDRHRFITVELSADFLTRHLTGFGEDLHPLIRAATDRKNRDSGVATPESLNARQRELVASLRQPPVLASAQELFCHRQQRVARDRVDQVLALLRRELTHPPSLEEIGRAVGCSPFYLSRTFSKETGQTIPQYIRQLRMEKAAALLRSGDYNVTEVALEVGYNSLSHFSQAFHQTYGCCPGLYPMATPTQRAAGAG